MHTHARLSSIVDVYDALTTDRVYRRAMTPEMARTQLRDEARCNLHSRELVEEFIAFCTASLTKPLDVTLHVPSDRAVPTVRSIV